MKTIFKNTKKTYRRKLLATSVAAVCSMIFTTSVSQASDIEIYQQAKSGQITLLFMIDVSGSMDEKDGGSTTRLSRVKTAMTDLLSGNVSKKIDKIGDDKIIGLSTLGALKWGSVNNSSSSTGAIIVPARALGDKVDGEKTQRQILLEQVDKLTATTATPTGKSYLEGISYMLGNYVSSASEKYSRPETWTKISNTSYQYNSPTSLTQTNEVQKCSGQGLYMLTDGEPNGGDADQTSARTALGYNSLTCSGNWDCIQKSSLAFLDSTKNSKQLAFKTAVVGFGSSFNSIPSYDKNKTFAENIKPFVDSSGNKKSNLSKQQEAAYWGIIGEGGWYSGNNSQDVVNSVNDFINSLSTTIPSVTTGSPTIPKDALNPAILQDDAYYQQFQPTPDKSYQLWTGNLKKYLVTTGGILKDKKGTAIVDADGKIVANYDYWAEETTSSNQSADENTVGSDAFALRGGAWSKLLLRTNPLNNPSNGVVQRKVFTNRIYTNGSFVSKSDELRQVKPTDLTDTNYKNDEYRGYLVRALGYNIDAATPPTSLDNLKTAVEFRQTGAVMHSQPILVTNKGKLEFNESTQTMGSTGREDYVLFGTTQGALHVVKAGTSGIAGGGEEVFTFIPNEMLVKQKQAFEKPEVTSGGTNQLFYGIDGPWTAYTEYVVDGSGYLTVGDGKGDQKGVQNVYGGLRMGGRSYYALDLKDIQNPKLKFHINPDSALAGTPLSYMGQSWSKPTIGFVNWAGKRTRVMFVGGGYDDGYESTSYDQTNKKGAGVYMFSAEDTSIQDGNNTIAIKAGELLWWSSANATTSIASTKSGVVGINSPNMQYSVVSEIRSVDRDGDDLIDHVYFGDLGGQIFRTDFNNKEKTIGSWAKAPILIFDEHKANGKSPRFYDMPAFSLYNNNGSIFAVVSQGSGNRSAPLFADSSYDYDAIYNIYDKDVARTDLYNYDSVKNPLITKNIKVDNVSGLRLINDDKRKDNTDGKGNILYNAPASAHGWYYKFTDCVTGYGKCDSYKQQTEKVFGTPIALNNKLFVSTFDASKDGLAGDCGAGVKGASLMTTFCLPFGQCAAGDVTGTTHTMIGAGIHTVTVGNGNSSGNGGSTGGGTGGVSSKLSSASNYCIATGSRVTITVTGSSGSGEQTRMCLVPQRWYEKL
ncbi:pilus assembly protein PilY [Acinetobacter johnsonii]|mgnify:CR=1 FL=1|jgi:type IV pilus assembly protein PilY1|uniref:pilus assembly protein PilY n=1 Tax=Acinetobacter johnsonii TaxID=40214 RepID=UPI002449D53D|nr:pilus assembly protein PilY [Acinetobacter johnsonii]MDH1488121.1 pilus assembly protein PilY [Acinetobacter johnsonii]MDH1614053.1 pilus assembly protein PilY [Acinetobacter johnsonii]